MSTKTLLKAVRWKIAFNYMNCYYIFSNKNNVLIIDMNDIQFDILVVSHKTNAAKNKKAMPLSINAILFQQRSAFLLHITYTVFSFFIGFVIRAIFLKIYASHAYIHAHTYTYTHWTTRSSWSCAAGARAWLAEIHFVRFTCRTEIACLVRICGMRPFV